MIRASTRLSRGREGRRRLPRDTRDRRGTMEDFLRILKQQDGEVTAFSEKLWCGLLDYATAYADGRLTFTFKNSSTFEG